MSIKGTNYIDEIQKEFGEDILDEDGNLRRKQLAEIIYSDEQKREKLNNCTFKYIRKEIEKQIENLKNQNITVIIDAPLLFECKLDELCTTVIGVISNKKLQIERIIARDNIEYEHAEKRLGAQQENTFYIDRCDEIIANDNDLKEIQRYAQQIAKKYNITERLH